MPVTTKFNSTAFKLTTCFVATLILSAPICATALDIGGVLKQIQSQTNPRPPQQPPSSDTSSKSQQTQKPVSHPPVTAETQDKGIDQGYLDSYGGLYAFDCKKPDVLSVTLNKTAILILIDAQAVKVNGLETSHTTFGQEIPDGYEITIESDNGTSMQIFKDKKGYYAEIYGSRELEKKMGGAGKRLSFCGKTQKMSMAAQQPSKHQTAQPGQPKDSAKRVELIFHDANEKDIELIKQNEPLGEWIKKYTKLTKDAGAGEIKTIKGYKIPSLIKVAPFGNDASILILRAPVLGPGFDDVLVISRNPISVNRINFGQEKKYFLVTSSIKGKSITTIRHEKDGKLLHILDSDITAEAQDTLLTCNLDEDYFKEETYEVMIAEGVLNMDGNKVLGYSTGGAPALGHTIEISAPLSTVEKIIRRIPPLEKVKFPYAKNIPKTCTAEARLFEREKGVTLVSCGCNVESGDSD